MAFTWPTMWPQPCSRAAVQQCGGAGAPAQRYNLRRKLVLLALWGASPLLVAAQPGLWGPAACLAASSVSCSRLHAGAWHRASTAPDKTACRCWMSHWPWPMVRPRCWG